MNEISEIVKSIKNDAALEATRLIESTIKDKVMAALVARRKVVAQGMFNNQTK